MKMDLKGLRILNTRPQHQAEILNQQILAANGCPLNCPALEIIPSDQSWLTFLPDLTTVTHAIFISTNAVTYSFETFLQQQLPWPKTIKITAIGKSTADSLHNADLVVHHYPEIADSEHLLALDIFQQVKNETILLFKGEGGRPLITDTLKARGANVIELDVYQRTLPSVNRQQLNTWWREDAVDIILFTSYQAMQNIFNLFEQETHEWLRQKMCLVISERLAIAARSLGMNRIRLCTVDTILESLQQLTKD